MTQAVLEMEITEREIEIQQLKQQLKRIDIERNRIIEELNLDKDTLKSNENISFVTASQLRNLISLLAHERTQNRRK